MPAPVSATSISTPPATSSARTVTLPSGGVWWIAFWIRLKSTRWSCSWLPCEARAAGAARRGPRPAGVGASGASLRPRRRRARPAARAPSSTRALGLQPGEVEEVVDQRAERAHVGVHAGRVLAPLGVLDDLVVDRGGQQAERGDRRAQVVRDGGEELAPHALLALEADDHASTSRPSWRLVVPAGRCDVAAAVATAERARSVEVVERQRRPGGRSRAPARRRRRPAGSSSARRGWRRTSGPRTGRPSTASASAPSSAIALNWLRSPPGGGAIASPASTVMIADRRDDRQRHCAPCAS